MYIHEVIMIYNQEIMQSKVGQYIQNNPKANVSLFDWFGECIYPYCGKTFKQ